MDIGLDDDQRQLRDSVRSVLAQQCPPALTRQSYDDDSAWQALWKTMVELGWTGLLADEPVDGEVVNLVALLEESGAATVPAPLLSTAGLAAGAARAARDEYGAILARIADGAVAVLLAEPGGRTPPGTCLTLTGGLVTGRVAQVRDAARAETFLGLAADADGTSHLVAFGPNGVEIAPAESVDPSQPVAAVTVDTDADLAVPVDVEAALLVPLIVAAAELVGVSDRAVSMAVAHAKTREQFGQPIGAFQAVKHRLADAYVGVERARSLTYLAAALAESADAGAWRAALLAKASAGDAALAATRANVATHGAIAQTWEHDAHLLLRRAWQGVALLGEPGVLHAAAGRDYLKAVGQ